jgi:hypothetical protein
VPQLCPLIPTSGDPTALIYGGRLICCRHEGSETLIRVKSEAEHEVKGTQLGYPALPERHLWDLLLFPGEDVPQSFLPTEIPLAGFDQSAMLDIDLFVRVFGSELMVVNGQNDPWSAEPFTLGPGTRDSFAYLVPSANHSARLVQLPLDQQNEAIAVIRRWAGGGAATTAGTLCVESLDRVYEVEAGRPHSRWASSARRPMAQAPPLSSQLYLLEDHARTLFPLTTTKVVALKALAEVQQPVAKILDQKTSDAFLGPRASAEGSE